MWLREIGLEFVDIIVKSDNEPALTSLIESWSNLRAIKGGMIVENTAVAPDFESRQQEPCVCCDPRPVAPHVLRVLCAKF